MSNFKICELGIAMNPWITSAQLRKRLIAHRKTCPNHVGEPLPKNTKVRR